MNFQCDRWSAFLCDVVDKSLVFFIRKSRSTTKVTRSGGRESSPPMNYYLGDFTLFGRSRACYLYSAMYRAMVINQTGLSHSYVSIGKTYSEYQFIINVPAALSRQQ